MMSKLIDGMAAANLKHWRVAKMTREQLLTVVAKKICAPSAKTIYKLIEEKTGVPWWFIGVVHYREASQDWNANLAQGDPYNRKSTHVPVGRGPFPNFVAAAIDALANCPPYAATNKDWGIGRTLAYLEMYNGAGYYYKGLPSAYVWSGTDQYVMGKYIADGVWSATTVDVQMGCAGLLMAMRKIDHDILLLEDDKTPTHETPAVVVLPPKPWAGPWLAHILSWLKL